MSVDAYCGTFRNQDQIYFLYFDVFIIYFASYIISFFTYCRNISLKSYHFIKLNHLQIFITYKQKQSTLEILTAEDDDKLSSCG